MSPSPGSTLAWATSSGQACTAATKSQPLQTFRPRTALQTDPATWRGRRHPWIRISSRSRRSSCSASCLACGGGRRGHQPRGLPQQARRDCCCFSWPPWCVMQAPHSAWASHWPVRLMRWRQDSLALRRRATRCTTGGASRCTRHPFSHSAPRDRAASNAARTRAYRFAAARCRAPASMAGRRRTRRRAELAAGFGCAPA
jgi:hypothetical protein